MDWKNMMRSRNLFLLLNIYLILVFFINFAQSVFLVIQTHIFGDWNPIETRIFDVFHIIDYDCYLRSYFKVIEAVFKRPEACNFNKKENLAQVFSCDFCKIFKNTFFYRIPLVAASEVRRGVKWLIHLCYIMARINSWSSLWSIVNRDRESKFENWWN